MHSRIPNNILETIGNTQLVALRRLWPESSIKCFGKLEPLNPGGSIKDRTALQIIEHALENGYLAKGNTVIESSSGNMAIGLAQVCLYFGLKLIVVVDPNINPHTLKILKAYDATIEKVESPAEDGGYLSARIERVHQLLDTVRHGFWPNQYANRQNVKAHWQTMDELVQAMDTPPDYLFAATSTCGTLMGCAEYVQQKGLGTKLIAVDAFGSALFGGPDAERKIPGHGAGRPSPILKKHMIDDVIHVSDWECVTGCRKLLRNEAILCGGSSGGVISAIERHLPFMAPDSVCAAILCDRGERYLDTIYNDRWVEENILDIEQVQA